MLVQSQSLSYFSVSIVKVINHRKFIFLYLLFAFSFSGFAQEESAPVVNEPEPPIQINPEAFRFLLAITAFIVVAGISYVIVRSYKRGKKKRENIISEINKAYKSGDLMDADYDELKKGLDPLKYEWLVKTFSIALANKQRYNYLFSKYPKDLAQDLFDHKHWIGMTSEQLIDSRGHADKTQDEILTTKTIKKFIYKTSSGEECFSFVKGVLQEFNGK